MADIPQWWMRGDWFDVCSCDIACPCEFAQPPTNNQCEGVLAYHVREGAYGDVRLDGLNVLGVSHFEGNIWAGQAKVSLGLFIDERADGPQRQALQMVFSGQAGGFMANFARLINEVRGIEFVPISFAVADDLAYWRAEVPGKVMAAAEALTGPMTPPGKRVQLLNPPGSEVGPGQIATWGGERRHAHELREGNYFLSAYWQLFVRLLANRTTFQMKETRNESSTVLTVAALPRDRLVDLSDEHAREQGDHSGRRRHPERTDGH